MKEILLKLDNIHVHYGGVKALDGVSLEIDEAEVVALMGPNGAGKSTILKTIFGLAKLDSGNIFWHSSPLKPVSHEVVQLGISYVPQGRRVFKYLTVRENLELGGIVVPNKTELKRRIKEIFNIFPVLLTKESEKSSRLSGGQQQMLAIARGLIANPKVLLLDEPTLGLAPKIVKEIFEKIREISQRHKTAIFIVEHNIKSLLNVVDRAYVLNHGKVVKEGKVHDLLDSNILEKVFLGLPLD